MTDMFIVFSFVMNVFLLIAVIALAGDRRNLSEQVRWLQQQIEQLQRELERERGVVYGSGGSSGLLLAIVLGAAIVALIAYLGQAK
jgi:hypothetical protein